MSTLCLLLSEAGGQAVISHWEIRGPRPYGGNPNYESSSEISLNKYTLN